MSGMDKLKAGDAVDWPQVPGPASENTHTLDQAELDYRAYKSFAELQESDDPAKLESTKSALRNYREYRRKRGEESFQYLDEWKERKDAEQNAERTRWFGKMFAGPDAFIESQSPENQEQLKAHFGSDTEAIQTAANLTLGSHLSGKPKDRLQKVWPAYRQHIAEQVFGATGDVDDARFYGLAGQYFAKKEAEQDLASNVYQEARAAALQGKSLGETLKEFRATNQGEDLKQFEQFAVSAYGRVQSDFSEDEIKAARTLWELLAKAQKTEVEEVKTEGADVSQRIELRNEMQSIYGAADDSSRQRIIGLVGLMAENEGEDVEEFFARASEAWSSGNNKLGAGINSLVGRGMRMASGMSDEEYREQAPELAAATELPMDLATAGITARRFIDRNADNWMETVTNWTMMAVQSGPHMLGMSTPSGVPYVLTSFSEENRKALLSRNPDLSEGAASAMAYAAGTLQTGIERLKLVSLNAKLPRLRSTLYSKFGNTGVIADAVARVGVVTGLEGSQEILQNVTPDVIEAIGSALNEDVGGVDYKEILKREHESLGDTFGVSLMFGIVGGMGSSSVDYFGAGAVRERLQNEKGLLLSGYPKAAAKEISELAGEGKTAAAAELLKAYQVEIDPEVRAENAAREQEAAKRETEIIEAEAAIADLPQLEIGENGEYILNYPDGTRIEAESQEDALQAVREWELSDDDSMTRANRELAAFLEEFHQGSPDLRADVKMTGKSGEMEVRKWAEDSKISIEQARARVRIMWIQEGKSRGEVDAMTDAEIDDSSVLVRGSSRNFGGVVTRIAARINREGNPATVLEEHSEGVAKWAMASGRLSEGKMVFNIRKAEAATGKTTLHEDLDALPEDEKQQEIAEAFGRLAVANAFGRMPQVQGLSATFHAILRSLKKSFAEIFKLAAGLKQFRETGGLDKNFEEVLDIAGGVSVEYRKANLDRAAEQEMMDAAREGMPEIQESAKGRLPRWETMKERGDSLWSESKRLYEGLQASGGNKAAGTRKANEYFLPLGEYVDPDRVRESLNGDGFDFETVAELFEALDVSINYDSPQYGAKSFSLGKTDGQQSESRINQSQPGGAGNTGDAASPDIPRDILGNPQPEHFIAEARQGFYGPVTGFWLGANASSWNGKLSESIGAGTRQEALDRILEKAEALGFVVESNPQFNPKTRSFKIIHRQAQALKESKEKRIVEKEARTLARAESEGKPTFVRYTPPPESGRSWNGKDGYSEAGVSVYPAWRLPGNSYVIDLRGMDLLSSMMIIGKGDLYEAIGAENVGNGADGEPLLKGGKYKKLPKSTKVETVHSDQSPPEASGESFSISPAQDSAYLSAVESGDMETAQAMVYMAAKAAGYEIDPFFHIGQNNITSFRAAEGRQGVGVYFTDGPATPREALALVSNISAGGLYAEDVQSQGLDQTLADLQTDGNIYKVFLKNPIRNGDGEAVVRTPAQIKSADPVTYDADGNVIPLSERFNPADDRISFSVGLPSDRVQQAIEKLVKAPERKAEVYQRMLKLVQGARERVERAKYQRGFEPEDFDDSRFESLKDVATLEAVARALPVELRGKVISSFRKLDALKTAKGRENYLIDLLPKVESALESHLQKLYRKAIRKQIKQAKVRVSDAKTRGGKITAEGHAVFDAASEAMDLSLEKAEERAEEITQEIENAETLDFDEMDALDAKRAAFELFYDFSNADSARLEQGLNLLRGVYKEGRKRWIETLVARKELKRARISKIVEGLGYTGDRAERVRSKRKDEGFWKSLNEGLMQKILSGSQIIRRLGELTDDAEVRSVVERFELDIMKAESSELQLNMEDNQAFMNAMKEILGVSTEYALTKKLRDYGTSKDDAGITTLEGRNYEEISVPIKHADQLLNREVSKIPSGKNKGHEISLAQLKELEKQMEWYEDTPEDERGRKTVFKVKTIKASGQRKTLGELSQLEALNLYLTMRQPDQREKLEGMGYDQQTWTELNSFLKDEVLALGHWMTDYLNKDTEAVNALHKQEKGVGLGLVENYFPIRNDVARADMAGLSLDGNAPQQAGRSSEFFKERVTNRAEPAVMDALSVFLAHRAQVNFWKSHVKPLREWGGVVRDSGFAAAVRSRMGDAYYNALENRFQRIESGGKLKAGRMMKFDRLVRGVMRRFSMGTLGWRLSTIMVNLSAGLNIGLEMPLRDFLKGTALAMKRPEAFKDAWNSPVIQQRLKAGATYEAQVAKSTGPDRRPLVRTLDHLGVIGVEPINWADTGANLPGAAAMWELTRARAEEAGASKEDARQAADDATERFFLRAAQPTSRLSRSEAELSAQDSPYIALFTLFLSEPRKNLAAMYMAGREVLTGKGYQGKEQAIQTLVVAAVMMKALEFGLRSAYDALAKADEDDEEGTWNRFASRMSDGKAWAHQLAASHFVGIPLVGSVWENSVAGVVNELDWIPGEDRFVFSGGNNPLDRLRQKGTTGIRGLLSEDSNTDDAIDTAQAIGSALPGGAILSQLANAAETAIGVHYGMSAEGRSERLNGRLGDFDRQLKEVYGPTGGDKQIQAAKWEAQADFLVSELLLLPAEEREKAFESLSSRVSQAVRTEVKARLDQVSE